MWKNRNNNDSINMANLIILKKCTYIINMKK